MEERDAFSLAAKAILAADIMTPTPYLERADTYEEARSQFATYDVVPYPKSGRLVGYFQKGKKIYHPLTEADFISDSTPILFLPDLLSRRKFFFVLSQAEVVGYVHYSDMNRTAAKLPFFALFEALEARLWSRLNRVITDEDVRAVLPKRAGGILKGKRERIKNDTDIGWIGLFSFREILRLGCHRQMIKLSGGEESLLANKRNAVAHADHSLVSHYLDVRRLCEARRLCQDLISRLDALANPPSTTES